MSIWLAWALQVPTVSHSALKGQHGFDEDCVVGYSPAGCRVPSVLRAESLQSLGVQASDVTALDDVCQSGVRRRQLRVDHRVQETCENKSIPWRKALRQSLPSGLWGRSLTKKWLKRGIEQCHVALAMTILFVPYLRLVYYLKDVRRWLDRWYQTRLEWNRKCLRGILKLVNISQLCAIVLSNNF